MTQAGDDASELGRLREIIGNLLKIGPRPWMDGGVSWADWDAAMSAAEAVAEEGKTDDR